MNVPETYPEIGTETAENLEQFRGFKGVWIPRELWLSKLSALEKCFIAEIDSLSQNGEGCFASNKWFASFFGLSENRITFIITKLKKEGWLIQECFDGRRRSLKADLAKTQLAKAKGLPCESKRSDLAKAKGLEDADALTTKKLQKPLITECIKELIIDPHLAKIRSFVKHFYASQMKQYPTRVRNVTTSQIEQAIDTLDKLARIDKYPLPDVIKTIVWAMNDDQFWSKNVLSLVGLRSKSSRNGRTKFENIQTGMDEDEKSTAPRPGQPASPIDTNTQLSSTPLDSFAQELFDFVSSVVTECPASSVQTFANQLKIYYDKTDIIRDPNNKNKGPLAHTTWETFSADWIEFLREKQDGFPLRGVYDLKLSGPRWQEFIRRWENKTDYNFTTGKQIL